VKEKASLSRCDRLAGRHWKTTARAYHLPMDGPVGHAEKRSCPSGPANDDKKVQKSNPLYLFLTIFFHGCSNLFILAACSKQNSL
jgi:hypothetical protein